MISKYSVKKPFTVLVGVILVIVLGVVSLSRMTTDLLPDMSFQYALIITTDMGGKSPGSGIGCNGADRVGYGYDIQHQARKLYVLQQLFDCNL